MDVRSKWYFSDKLASRYDTESSKYIQIDKENPHFLLNHIATNT
jgi:hypothetical protein